MLKKFLFIAKQTRDCCLERISYKHEIRFNRDDGNAPPAKTRSNRPVPVARVAHATVPAPDHCSDSSYRHRPDQSRVPASRVCQSGRVMDAQVSASMAQIESVEIPAECRRLTRQAWRLV